MNRLTAKKRAVDTFLTPVCLAYLGELVILSNGDVTTCCLDAKAKNALGNVNQMSLDEIWHKRFLPWHHSNVEANLRGVPWASSLCNMCLEQNYMTVFNAKKTNDAKLIEAFHQLTPPFPVSLVIEPTSLCNYSCMGCYAGLKELNRGAQFLDFVSLKRAILPYISRVKQVRLYNYGEPFLHPDILDIIESLRMEGPELNLHISTNGMLLNDTIARSLIDAKVNYLIVSLHGGHTQEGLLRYSRSGPDINVIKSNLKNLIELKQRKGHKLPWVFLKAILFYWNDSEKEMQEFLNFGYTLGADFVGWGLNSSDSSLSSQRVAPGTQAYESLVQRKLLECNFYELPVWPCSE